MNDNEFDKKARQLYVDAAHDTPQVIRQRLRAALAAPRPSRQAWQPVVAFASVAVFAIGGLWLQRPVSPEADMTPTAFATAPVVEPVDAPPATAAAATLHAQKTAASATAAYDNDPEFYAWLGNDAPPVPNGQ
ncbi:MAG: hypothetical protein JSR70_08790 [Proteobacteria bacterium]|nr:hypothetical protein [Pseudomonadota bacterium]